VVCRADCDRGMTNVTTETRPMRRAGSCNRLAPSDLAGRRYPFAFWLTICMAVEAEQFAGSCAERRFETRLRLLRCAVRPTLIQIAGNAWLLINTVLVDVRRRASTETTPVTCATDRGVLCCCRLVRSSPHMIQTNCELEIATDGRMHDTSLWDCLLVSCRVTQACCLLFLGLIINQ
jgi:hypothetical protein